MGILSGASKQPRLKVRLEETVPQRPTVTTETDCVNMPAKKPRVPRPGFIKEKGGAVIKANKLKLTFKTN